MRQHHLRVVGHLVRLQPHRTGALAPADHEALAGRGHFRRHPEELAWGPFPVLAHLRDHALWTYAALQRMRSEDDPLIAPFERSDPPGRQLQTRLLGYALDGQVRGANALLSATAASVGRDETNRHGDVLGVGVRTVQHVLLREVAHLEDHLAQLDTLQGRVP
jgi:hypothetical protein